MVDGINVNPYIFLKKLKVSNEAVGILLRLCFIAQYHRKLHVQKLAVGSWQLAEE